MIFQWNVKLSAWLFAIGFALSISSPTIAFAANEAPRTFTLDGRIFSSPTSSTPLLGAVTINVKILDPSGSCVLYEESQPFNTTATNGYFNIPVGSPTSDAKRVGDDPNHSMEQVYQNVALIPASNAGCAAGYTPSAGDSRAIRITVTPTATGIPQVFTPDMRMDAVPTAIVAESIQGLSRDNMLELNTNIELTQSNIENVFSVVNYPKLTALLNGTSTDYMKATPAAAVSFNNQRITSVAAPTAGTDAANKNYVDGNIGGKAADTVVFAGIGAGDAGKVMIWDGTKWTAATAPGDATKLPLAGGTMTGAINMNSQNLLGTGHITMSSQTTLNLGTYTNGQEAVLVLGLAAVDKGKFWYNTDLPGLKVWDGTAAVPVLQNGSAASGDLSGTYPSPTIAANAIIASKINDGAVTSGKILDGTITGTDIANSTVADVNISGVGAGKITSGAGVYFTYAPNNTPCTDGQYMRWDNTNTRWVCGTPADNGITALTGDVTASGNGSVAATISNDAVTNTKIAALAVTDAKVNDVGVSKISSGAGQYFGYMPGNVACSDGQVLSWDNTNSRWVCGSASAGSVTGFATGTGLTGGPITSTGTISIAAGGVSATELATDAVTSTKILDGTIATIDIADNAITANKINSLAVTTDKLFSNPGINYLVMTDGTTGSTLVSKSCSPGEILKWTVTGWGCAGDDNGGGTVTAVASGTGLTGGTITGVGTISISAGGVGSTELAANSVVAAKINDGAVTSAGILDGTIAATDLSSSISNGLWSGNGTNVYRTTGSVGIGTTAPAAAYPLDVAVGANDIRVWGTSTAGGNGLQLENRHVSTQAWLLAAAGGSAQWSPNKAFFIRDMTAGLTRFVISPTGEVGIGTSIPNSQLTIAGVTSLGETTAPAATAGYGKLYVKSSDSKLYFMDDSGLEKNISDSAAGGTVTGIATGTGLAGGPIGTTGTISIAAGGVSATELASNAVTNAKLNDGAVDSAKILDGSIATADIAAKAITTALINDYAVTALQLNDDAVTSAGILDGAINVADLNSSIANGLWSGNGTDVYRTSGKVGIGTTAPGMSSLELNRSLNSGTLISAINTNTGTAAWAGFALGATSTFGSPEYGELVYLGANFTPAGIYQPRRTTLLGNDSAGLALGATHASGVISFTAGGNSVSNERMRIAANGNVGIGTTSPNALLTVAGVTALGETAAPALTVGYGKLYVKSSDSKLYFMDDSGLEKNISDSAAGGTVTGIATGTGLAGGPIGTTGTISIAAGGVSETELASNAVTNAKLNDGAVDSAKILDGAIATADIAAKAITTALINDYAVTALQLNDDAVTSTKILDGTISTLDISAKAITTALINDAAITALQINDGAVTSAGILDGAISAADLNSSIANGLWSGDGTNVWRMTNRVGIGTSAPTTFLSISNNAASITPNTGSLLHLTGPDGWSAAMTIDGIGASSSHSPYFTMRKAKGTAAAPTSVTLNNILGAVQAQGYESTGATHYQGAAIYFSAAENWDATRRGGKALFEATPWGTATSQTLMELNSTVHLGFIANRPLNSWTTTGATLNVKTGTIEDQTGSGTIATRVSTSINAPTYSSVNPVVVTNASNFYIAGPPVAGTNTNFTNSQALHVASGNSLFGGNVIINSTGAYLNYRPNGVACSDGQVLSWDNANSRWVCASAGGTGTVTAVASGTGLTGGTITGNGTLSIAAGGVSETELASNAVTAVKLNDDAVLSAKILDGTIATADIAAKAITTALINDAAITALQINDGAVTSAGILDGAIVAADLNSSITDGLWTANSGNVYRSSGRVGIGTTSPAGILDVRGGTAAAATNGANIDLYAQNAGVGNQNGGNINLFPGSATGSGIAGQVVTWGTSLIVHSASGGSGGSGVYSSSSWAGAPNANAYLVAVEGNASSIATGANITTSTIAGVKGDASTGGSAFWTTGTMIGGDFVGTYTGNSQPATATTGVRAIARNTGTNNTITAKGIDASVLRPSGTITDGYGVYVGSVQATNKWSVFASDATAPSYFAGNVGVGTTVPNALLTVAGVAALGETTAPTATSGYGKLYVKSSDSKLYFMDDSGVETDLLAGGGGSGTVTSVQTGTGLTGGGFTTTGTIGISAGGVSATELASNAVTAVKLNDDAVTSAKILDGTIATEDIAAKAITTALINDAAITATQINNGAVTSTGILDGAILAADLNSSITNGLWSVNGTDVYRSSGKVGIGSTAPMAPLTVTSNQLTDGGRGVWFANTMTPPSPGAGQPYIGFKNDTYTAGSFVSSYVTGISNYVQTSSGAPDALVIEGISSLVNAYSGASGSIVGIKADVNKSSLHSGDTYEVLGLSTANTHSGTGTVTNGYGASLYIRNDSGSKTTNQYGLHVHNYVFGVGTAVTNAYGGRFKIERAVGTLTNGYGIYLDDVQATNQWGFYQAGSDDINYFAGKVGVGTTVPNEKLTVSGVTSLAETAAPTNTAGYGKLYVKSADSKLYFMDDSGVETDLLAGGGGAASSVAASVGSAGAPSISFSGDTNTGFYNASSDDTISVAANGANIFNFSSAGLVSPTAGGAAVTSAAGVVGAPTYSFAGDLDTGWWSPAADTMAASTAGAERMRIDASGNVGIGTTAPTVPFEVLRTVSADVTHAKPFNVTLDRPAGAANVVGNYSAGSFNANAQAGSTGTLGNIYGLQATAGTFGSTSSTTITGFESWAGAFGTSTVSNVLTGVRSSASAGVNVPTVYGVNASASTAGTSTDMYAVYGQARNQGTTTNLYGVYGNANQTAGPLTSNAYGGYFLTNITSGLIANGYGVYIGDTQASNPWGLFQSGTNDRNYFAGDVGIGTSIPGWPLHVIGSGAKTTTYNGTVIDSAATSSTASIRKVGLWLQSAGSWTGAGAVNIGLNVLATGGTTNYAATFYGGSVGIGTTAPLSDLELASTNSTGSVMTLSRVDSTATAGDVVGKLQFWNNDSQLATQPYFGSIEMQSTQTITTDAAAGNMIFKTTGTTLAGSPLERLRIAADGFVGIGTTSPRTALDVSSGAISGTPAVNNGTATVNFSAGNIQYTTQDCGAFALWHLKDGSAYTFVVQGTNVATCSFTAFSDGGSTALTVHMPPDHGPSISGKHTVYTMFVAGSHLYLSWVPGY